MVLHFVLPQIPRTSYPNKNYIDIMLQGLFEKNLNKECGFWEQTELMD